jgi:hypothetical protein
MADGNKGRLFGHTYASLSFGSKGWINIVGDYIQGFCHGTNTHRGTLCKGLSEPYHTSLEEVYGPCKT